MLDLVEVEVEEEEVKVDPLVKKVQFMQHPLVVEEVEVKDFLSVMVD